MKKILFLILVFSANLFVIAQNKVVIEGKVLNGKGKTLQLVNGNTNSTIAQKVLDEKGDFKFETELSEPTPLMLYIDKYHNLWLFIYPDEKDVKITYDLLNLDNSTIEGSHCSLVYLDALKGIVQQPTTNQKYEEIAKSMDEHPNCLSSVLLGFYILDVPGYEKTHEKLIASLSDSLKKLQLVQEYIKEFNKRKITAIGAVAPEISLPDTNGNIVKLSQFRGQYVLVDFWASWCRPCRYESPNLVEAYNKFHDKGFTIFSVSLDADKSSWLKAIHKDKLGQWTHVSDLKYWQSEAAKTYGVNAIPSNFLLDPEGKIIAKNLRGRRLVEKLTEIFESNGKN